MVTLLPQNQQLQTKFVFVDTEAFRRAQFDWSGKALSKFVQFAEEGHLRLLITDITKREVCIQLQEILIEAVKAGKKHEIVLEQLGSGAALAALNDPGALAKLQESFSQFQKLAKVIEVPVATESIAEVFEDYFARNPPSSDKKKSEFPDAVVIASIKAWCAQRKTKAYIVSGDPDLQRCCLNSATLLHAASIEDIISQATVSKELHDVLLQALSHSEELRESFSEQLRELKVLANSHWRHYPGSGLLSATVQQGSDIDLCSMNVLEREGLIFSCEIEFRASVDLQLLIRREERQGYGYEDYEAGRVYRIESSISRDFGAEVVVKFDPNNPNFVELQSVDVLKENIYLEPDELIGH